ncbi:hypothetical protein GE09DRAFT_695963 [Coniochaeta sp. 2T2.1]|nr:hypothetical protein GE09DRAFT_695963 [Coniochaeta sp. 2T2.1]
MASESYFTITGVLAGIKGSAAHAFPLLLTRASNANQASKHLQRFSPDLFWCSHPHSPRKDRRRTEIPLSSHFTGYRPENFTVTCVLLHSHHVHQQPIMSHRKHPSTAETGLDKTEVAPGRFTGVYYIIISGLRKDTQWKEVKDFLRDADIDGSLDNVQIHPGTTTGWVRVFGNPGFHAAMRRFKSANFGKNKIIPDGRQETEFTEITNLDIKPPNVRPPSVGESGVFAGQIPSLPVNDGGSSGHMPQNVSMSYMSPVVASSGGGGYVVQSAYGQLEPGYYQTHPTQYDNSHKARMEEFYGVSSGALVDDMASLAVGDSTPQDSKLPKFTPADFKITVKRHSGGVITKDMVEQFVQGVAPGAMWFVPRIDILMGRGKHRGPASQTGVDHFHRRQVVHLCAREHVRQGSGGHTDRAAGRRRQRPG